MANQIAAQGVHHFRLTVSNVDRAVKFYTEVLGFTKLMDLNPGAFLSNGSVGLGIGPHPFPDRRDLHRRVSRSRQRAAGGQRAPEVASSASRHCGCRARPAATTPRRRRGKRFASLRAGHQRRRSLDACRPVE
ncbi:MAG: hypothetical protein DMD76_01085 [Candidatus Rokuibacteriota bacterium]|nr:MAG: hypothetical protein DMD76_01085 [Candidatus Rokubacteria bacterium]